MSARNVALADQLAEVAALLRTRKGDRYRIRAYERAARLVRAAPVELSTLDETEIRRLEGIGPAIAGLITEYLRTGAIGMLQELRDGEPEGVGALLQLPLIGVRDARTLAAAGFPSVAQLQEADPQQLAAVGERLAARVQESLRRLETRTDGRVPLPLARRDARAAAELLRQTPDVDAVTVAGDVRRGAETVDRFAFCVTAADVRAARTSLAHSPAVVRVLDDAGEPLRVMLGSGRTADLWCATPEAAAAALLFATGSPAHVDELVQRAAARSMRLDPQGLFENDERIAGDEEAAIYRRLGLPFLPPELREGAGEIAAAEHGELGRLVAAGDLLGDLHVHSDWSRDGKATLEAMVAAAAGRGYAYVAITDHAENLTINGMSRQAVLARRDAIAQLQDRHPDLCILDAAELNIALDGTLDYDLEFLLDFDLGVASIHSHMDRPSPQQTDRILAAIAHPAVHVIGHPTGRITGHRPGYGIELEAIAQAAAETGTALEVNGSPRRLDLSGAMVRIALRAGALVSLSSDAHSVAELRSVENAATTARRGWATPVDVLNTRPLDQLSTFTQGKRRRTG